MSTQLYEQTTLHDGDHHWIKYIPAIELVRCHECCRYIPHSDGTGFCIYTLCKRDDDEYCSAGKEE